MNEELKCKYCQSNNLNLKHQVLRYKCCFCYECGRMTYLKESDLGVGILFKCSKCDYTSLIYDTNINDGFIVKCLCETHWKYNQYINDWEETSE